jgi:hypothetical protein
MARQPISYNKVKQTLKRLRDTVTDDATYELLSSLVGLIEYNAMLAKGNKDFRSTGIMNVAILLQQLLQANIIKRAKEEIAKNHVPPDFENYVETLVNNLGIPLQSDKPDDSPES